MSHWFLPPTWTTELKATIGEVGDAHEEHADDVADLVAQGKSAAHLVGATTRRGGPAIQLKEKKGTLGASEKNQAARLTLEAAADEARRTLDVLTREETEAEKRVSFATGCQAISSHFDHLESLRGEGVDAKRLFSAANDATNSVVAMLQFASKSSLDDVAEFQNTENNLRLMFAWFEPEGWHPPKVPPGSRGAGNFGGTDARALVSVTLRETEARAARALAELQAGNPPAVAGAGLAEVWSDLDYAAMLLMGKPFADAKSRTVAAGGVKDVSAVISEIVTFLDSTGNLDQRAQDGLVKLGELRQLVGLPAGSGNSTKLPPVATSGNPAAPALAGPQQDATTIDGIPVTVIDGAYRTMPLDKLGDDYFYKVLAGVMNYDSALADFETVVNNSSEKESEPGAGAAIAMQSFTNEFVNHLASYALGEIPIVGVFAELLQTGDILTGGANEDERAAEAGVSNKIKKFILEYHKKISHARTRLLSAKEISVAHFAAAATAKPLVRDEMIGRITDLNEALQGRFSAETLLTRLAAAWVEGSNAPGTDVPASLEIKLDKDWQLISAGIDAPRGGRIAEQLLSNGGGSVDLGAIAMKRTLTWLCFYPGDPLSSVSGDIDANGTLQTVEATLLAQDKIDEFEGKVASQGLPKASDLGGA